MTLRISSRISWKTLMALTGSSAASTAASEARVMIAFLNCGSLESPTSACAHAIRALEITVMIMTARSSWRTLLGDLP